MNGTVLQIYEDKNGRLFLRSDLPEEMAPEEFKTLVARIKHAMTVNLRGQQEAAVKACVRQLSFGAAMCESDLEGLKKSFREQVAQILPAVESLSKE